MMLLLWPVVGLVFKDEGTINKPGEDLIVELWEKRNNAKRNGDILSQTALRAWFESEVTIEGKLFSAVFADCVSYINDLEPLMDGTARSCVARFASALSRN
jgi:hypothetical protein